MRPQEFQLNYLPLFEKCARAPLSLSIYMKLCSKIGIEKLGGGNLTLTIFFPNSMCTRFVNSIHQK